MPNLIIHREDGSITKIPYGTPIEVRINKEIQNNIPYWQCQLVWPGVGNVTFSRHTFMTYRDAAKWAATEYPKSPRIRGW